jgi:hypothetical protein
MYAMRQWMSVALSSMLVLALVACGGGTDGAAQKDDEAGATAQGSAQAVDAEAAAQAEAEALAQAEYQRACELFDQGLYFSAREAFESSGYDDWEQRAAECVQQMPETGEIWHDESLESSEMELHLTVNGADDSVGRYFEVYTADHELAATGFVRGSGSISLLLAGGNYYIKDAQGTEWYGEAELFGRDGYYETMVFDEFEDDRYLTALSAGYEWEITINSGSSDGQTVSSEDTDWESWG